MPKGRQQKLMTQRRSPSLRRDALKLALFGANCSSGRSYITVPERWDATWDNNVALAHLAEDVGLDAMIPIARWKGYGGETNPNGSSFESTVWASGLLASTRHIQVFSTIHVPLINPVLAAKQMATAHQIGRGRFGVNVVCGWSEDEFGMFGVAKYEHDASYAQAEEWWQVIKRIWAGEAPFDFEGTYYQLHAVEGRPGPHGDKPPLMMNAGTSPAGRAFATRNSDMHFDGVGSAQATMERLQQTKQQADALGRSIQVWTPVGIICRPTRQDALDYLHYCGSHLDPGAGQRLTARLADRQAMEAAREGSVHRDGIIPTEERPTSWLAVARGSYCAIGSPDDVAAELQLLHNLGLDGLALNFVNYLHELPYFAQEVLPRMERLGLR
jgi:alkanesulfonate monooxygenase SsuD/methylene tetrahydromethanopterin reductase-like flavin-dependent oxidoreductase (luciferase family)